MTIRSRFVLTAIAAGCLFASLDAGAKEFMPRLGITVEDHSNVNRSDDPDKETADTVMRPYFGFIFEENTTDLNAKADVLMVYESYARNTFDSQLLPTIDMTLDWSIQPNRLSWVVEDYAYAQRVDTTAADTRTTSRFSTSLPRGRILSLPVASMTAWPNCGWPMSTTRSPSRTISA